MGATPGKLLPPRPTATSTNVSPTSQGKVWQRNCRAIIEKLFTSSTFHCPFSSSNNTAAAAAEDRPLTREEPPSPQYHHHHQRYSMPPNLLLSTSPSAHESLSPRNFGDDDDRCCVCAKSSANDGVKFRSDNLLIPRRKASNQTDAITETLTNNHRQISITTTTIEDDAGHRGHHHQSSIPPPPPIDENRPISITIDRSPPPRKFSERARNFNSCPDLIRPCVLNQAARDGLPGCTLSKRNSGKSSRKSSTTTTAASLYPAGKSLENWTLDDILVWLDKIGMGHVASLLIGYELSGSELESWNDHILTSYGITDASTRCVLLKSVQDLISRQKRLSCSSTSTLQVETTPVLARKWGRSSSRSIKQQRDISSLYDLIVAFGCDRIVAIDLPPDLKVSRAITVARKEENCLVITGCRNANIPALVGDIIIEYNGENCLPLAAVDFHVLTSQPSRSSRNTIVVLRRTNARETPPDNEKLRNDVHVTRL